MFEGLLYAGFFVYVAYYIQHTSAFSHEETLETQSKTYLPQRHREHRGKTNSLLAAPQA